MALITSGLCARLQVTGLAAAGHMLISVSWDQSVRFWDVLTGHQVCPTPGPQINTPPS